MQPQFIAAINQICDEKNISREVVIETVEAALAAAYKKDYGDRDQEVTVKLDEETGQAEVRVTKTVAPTIEDPFIEISLADAKKIKKTAKLGDTVEIVDTPSDFGRIAAQTAKQVIIQRIREAERDVIFNEYKGKEGDLLNGVVQRLEGANVLVDIGKTNGIMFPGEQIQGERYFIGQRLRVFVVRVEQSARGPQVVLSRSHPGMVKRLFELEVPEVQAGSVEIKAISREAGARSKVAVWSDTEGVDPVGSCVGQRGTRVQAVMADLGEEKIDIILWNADPIQFISNALSPAKVISVKLNEDEKRAAVEVPEDQLSLAIGRSGQNVRLAAKLTGWNVDIIGADEAGVEATERAAKRKDKESALLEAVAAQNAIDAEASKTAVAEAVTATGAEEATVAEATPEVVEPSTETEAPAEAAAPEVEIPAEKAAKAKPAKDAPVESEVNTEDSEAPAEASEASAEDPTGSEEPKVESEVLAEDPTGSETDPVDSSSS
jgi:N utilization substance protein A